SMNPSLVQNLYFGIRNDQFPQGETQAGTGGPTARSAAPYRFSRGAGSGITQAGNSNPNATTVFNPVTSSTHRVSNQLLLTRTSGSGTIVTTGGNPGNNGNADIGALFTVTSASFTVRVEAQAADASFPGFATSCGHVFDPTNTRSPGSIFGTVDQDVSRIDLGFYYESLPTPTATVTLTRTATATATSTATATATPTAT